MIELTKSGEKWQFPGVYQAKRGVSYSKKQTRNVIITTKKGVKVRNLDDVTLYRFSLKMNNQGQL